MFYTVYKITNLINNKIYIGVHKTNDINDNYMGSGKILILAQEKYGIENFRKEILEIFDNPEDMFAMESQLVNEEFINRTDAYNLKKGGSGGWEHVNSLPRNEEWLNKVAEKARLSIKAAKEKQKWLKENNKEWYENYISNLSLAMKKTWAENGHNWLGRSHSEETKKKISESVKGKHNGSKNSQYGTMWIYNLELKENKKIKKTDSIPDGWIKG